MRKYSCHSAAVLLRMGGAGAEAYNELYCLALNA